MKKIRFIAWLMLAAMLLSLAVSCGGSTANSKADTTSSKAPQTTEKPVTTTAPSVTEKPSIPGAPSVTEKPSKPSRPNTNDANFGLPEEMPVFHIDTDGVPITSKETYVAGALTISNTDEAYAMEDAAIEIRGRGNYSWSSTEKKSYRIKFAEKTNLLGQGNGPARSWTLLAVHCDQSLLRTAAAFAFARSLSGIDFSSSASFAKVYLNGEFLGVYQVSEQMQVHEYRVNVDDSLSEDDEIGFLVELNRNASELAVSDGFNSYEIKSEVYTEGQYYFIMDTLSWAWLSVVGGLQEEVEEVLDLDSVVDAYIVEELFKNLDVGWGSFYMHQDIGGKLHFGPVWDFDLSAGNADADDRDPTFPMPEHLYVGSDKYHYSQTNRWFVTLMQYGWFKELVRERWNEITDELNAVPQYVRTVAALYSEEFDENFKHWRIMGHQINREPAQVRALKNHDEHAEYVAQWLETRIAWLTRCFNGEVPADPGGEITDFVFSGGNGSKKSPYLIANAKDFASLTLALQQGETFEDTYFLQTADIDMAGQLGYNGIGSEGNFAGVYDGNGYVIHAEIEGQDQCVFPYVSGTVMNVITTGSVINSQQAAGIARSVRVGGRIVNCLSTMTISSAAHNAGGIVASNQSGGGTVSGCVFVGTVEAADEAGAINVFISGRGGEFSYNHYLKSAEGNSVGNETAFTEEEIGTLVETLNGNLSSLASGGNASSLCRWQLGDSDTLTMAHK